MQLFNTVEEIQKYFKINGTQKLSSLEGFERDALEKYVHRYTGEALLLELIEWYNAETAVVNEAFSSLLPFVQAATIKFAYYLGSPTLDLQISESGFGVLSTANLAPASKERVATFRASIQTSAWDSIEALLKFLEKNKSEYENWTNSSAYTIQTGLFINTAEEFNKHVNINDSVLKYLELKQSIEDVELLEIYPIITKELAVRIKEEIKKEEISESTQNIVTYIRKATANLTAFNYGMGDKYETTGLHYIMEVKRIMDAMPSDYPEYSVQIAKQISYQKIENTQESGIYIFGG
ncbi:MAG: DUF6712 family protein [Bacteroidota bacterium]